MSIFLKQFETQAAYEAAESGLILPNVSLTLDNNAVHYKPSSPVPPTPSHDYVEIGGIKWATMNVGANSITDTGLYFQWGDTQGYTADQVGCEEGKKCFDQYWSDYKWTEDGGNTFTKYTCSGSSGSGSGSGSDFEGDGLCELQPSDDAVTAAWGGQWRIPTIEEYTLLGNAVNTAWTQVDGVYGILCADKTDSSKTLFFPACGQCGAGSVYSVGVIGGYWSSSLDSSDVQSAYFLDFSNITVNWYDHSINRFFGYPVRGVLGE